MGNEDFLNGLIGKLEKKVENSTKFSDIDYFKDTASWLPTGSAILDFRLNTLGYPIGIIEIRGASQSGKTTLSLHALKNFQTLYPDCVPVILSTERRDNKVYAKSMGIDVNKVVVIKCRSIEDVFNKIQNTIEFINEEWQKAGKPGKPKFLFIWDSLGASISSQEKKAVAEAAKKGDEDHHKAAMAAAARSIKRGLRFMTGEVYDNDIWFIIINHTYDSMQAFTEGKSYGGKGIEFHPTMRLNVAKKGYVKVRDKKLGQTTIIKAIKSDFNSQLEEIEIEIMLGKGVILNDDELEFAVEEGILEKNGKNGYSFMNGKLKWNNRPELYDLYEKENKLLSILEKKIVKAAHDRVLEYRGLIECKDETTEE